MAEAEILAQSRGCHAAWLDTSGAPAERFYVGLGYELFGTWKTLVANARRDIAVPFSPSAYAGQLLGTCGNEANHFSDLFDLNGQDAALVSGDYNHHATNLPRPCEASPDRPIIRLVRLLRPQAGFQLDIAPAADIVADVDAWPWTSDRAIPRLACDRRDHQRPIRPRLSPILTNGARGFGVVLMCGC